MVTPSWVKTESQPVAIADVLHWLVRCLEVPETAGKTLEIGGPDVLPYRDLMRIMAEELHLPKRWIIPLPFLTPRLSSLWISLVTPVSYRIARPLGEGLRNRVVVTDGETSGSCRTGAWGCGRRSASRSRGRGERRRDAVVGGRAGPGRSASGRAGRVFTDRRSVGSRRTRTRCSRPCAGSAGGTAGTRATSCGASAGGWTRWWEGRGCGSGRRNSEKVEFGEALDFWRVVGVERDRSLSLRAEMKLPGEAKLNFDMQPGEGGTGPG